MPAYNVYKNGGIAVFHALQIVCRVVKRYGPKLQAYIDHLLATNAITVAQHDAATAFLATVNATCAIFAIIAAQPGA